MLMYKRHNHDGIIYALYTFQIMKDLCNIGNKCFNIERTFLVCLKHCFYNICLFNINKIIFIYTKIFIICMY